MAAEDYPAKSVSVIKTYQALCHVPGCTYAGRQRGDYQAANADRQAHLAWHRDRPERGRPI